LGFVVDYVDLYVWPVFNIADAAIVVGAGAIALTLAWRGRAPQSRR
jgi:lipoprotein signal peptidase